MFFYSFMFYCMLIQIGANTISNMSSPVLRGRPSSKRSIHICGRPRWVFVLFFSAGVQKSGLSKMQSHHCLQDWHHLFSWLQLAVYSGWPRAVFSQSSGHFSLLYLVRPVHGFKFVYHVQCHNDLLCCAATVLHASFRTPNLKARLNTFREEFRAVWRNYSEL